MKLRALVISPIADPEGVRYRDAKSVAIGLKKAGYLVTFVPLKELTAKADQVDVSSFDLICYQIPGNALHWSTPANFEFMTRLHREAKDGAMTLYYSDITFGIDPHIWNPDVGRSASKLNLMMDRPVRILGSFSEQILDDAEAMAHVDKTVLSKIHPESSFVPAEWLTFSYEDQVSRGGFQGRAAISSRLKIDRFYYGIDKAKLVPSLLSLGLGESENDAVFGTIVKRFPKVRDLRESPRKAGREYWLPHVEAAASVLVPYEPIKGDYQVTPRFLEALEFYPDKAEVDSQVADWMRPMASEHKAWIERMAMAVETLAVLQEQPGRMASRSAGSHTPATDTTTDKVKLNLSLDQGVMNVAGAIYRVVDLNAEPTVEGEPVEAKLLTDVELLERFAPGIDSTKASQAKIANDWLKSFAASEAIQVGFGVKVEKVDAGQVFDQRLENFRSLEEQARVAKKSLVSALRAVLADITKEEIEEGEIHSVSTGSKLKVGIVEVFVTKSKEPAKSLIAKYGDEFSPEVLAELDKISKKRSEEAARRTGRA